MRKKVLVMGVIGGLESLGLVSRCKLVYIEWSDSIAQGTEVSIL